MDKIYSRTRLILPKLNPNNFSNDKNKVIKMLKIIIIFTIALIVAISLIRAIEPIINRQCANMAKSLATKISNEQTTKVIKEYEYSNFIDIVQGDNGQIQMIKSNVISINEVTSYITMNIQDELNSVEDGDFSIRLGSFTGIKLFSGRGPKIYVRMSTVGSVETNLKSEFTSVGINQTLHRIYMEIKCNVAVLTPYSSSEETVINQVLIAESVIVGTTPETYYNLDGMTVDDSLNIM